MSSLYIFNHPNATKLIPSSREEILANEPILLALDQNFDFESLRGYIEDNLQAFRNQQSNVSNGAQPHDKQHIADEQCDADILTPLQPNQAIKSKYARANAGRPSYDPVLMFKIILLKFAFALSDNKVVRAIKDRRSFQVFLGVDESVVPDPKTVWKYHDLFARSRLFQLLFAKASNYIQELKIVKESDSLGVDSSFTLVPIQRNTREENKLIKEGYGETLWNDNPAKKRQKDINAAWTQKGGQRYFGYKLHASVCLVSKLIKSVLTTPACVHDSQVISPLITDSDAGKYLYADSAYSGQKQLSEIVNSKLIPAVCEKGRRNNPLTNEQKESNRQKSKIRARVEHVFGRLAHFGADEIRTIGIKRADAHHHLVAFFYNTMQLINLGIKIKF